MDLMTFISSHIDRIDSCNSVMALVVALPSVFSPLIVVAICYRSRIIDSHIATLAEVDQKIHQSVHFLHLLCNLR